MKHVQPILLAIFSVISSSLVFSAITAAEEGKSAVEKTQLPETTRIEQKLRERMSQLSMQIIADSESTAPYSQRGDAYFFLGEFGNAVNDYDQMVTLDAELDASHWRRGIAYFYNGDFDKATSQFERYNSFDNVDRENGIWRYFSMYKSQGAEKAQQELLKYVKDDREPFPDVYKLFSDVITPQQLIDRVELPELSQQEREKRKFYAYLYLGLNEAIEGRSEAAQTYLEKAVQNTWGPDAGYGPNFMWHVGRIQLEQLRSESQADD